MDDHDPYITRVERATRNIYILTLGDKHPVTYQAVLDWCKSHTETTDHTYLGSLELALYHLQRNYPIEKWGS